MDFYERIEELRNKEGLSQTELEKLLDFSNGSISKWKNSVPKADRLQKIAEHFNVTVDYILTGKMFPDGLLIETYSRDNNYNSEQINRLKRYYDMLNELGKEKVIDYMSDLLESDKYCNKFESSSTHSRSVALVQSNRSDLKAVAAHERTDVVGSEDDRKHDLDLLNDDDF